MRESTSQAGVTDATVRSTSNDFEQKPNAIGNRVWFLFLGINFADMADYALITEATCECTERWGRWKDMIFDSVCKQVALTGRVLEIVNCDIFKETFHKNMELRLRIKKNTWSMHLFAKTQQSEKYSSVMYPSILGREGNLYLLQTFLRFGLADS